MSKQRSIFICQHCGYEATGWLGKCPSCNEWNTFVEEVVNSRGLEKSNKNRNVKPVNINEIETEEEERYSCQMNELDRVLGGGLVKGSLILVGGDPGIGKSTLLLQVCEKIKTDMPILYVSGEESAKQIKIRADRLKIKRNNLLMFAQTNFAEIEGTIEKTGAKIVIIDSIQTIFDERLSSAPGSVSQVREATGNLMKIAKSNDVSIIIVGHVTKEGAIAGPRVLEHIVDTVLYFEGERHSTYRILRAVKNRFGSTNEIGIFEMRDSGLFEVENPSKIMLSERPKDVPGSVVISNIEGTRPMLVEIQALVSITNFGIPRRMATGFDINRITLLMAVLEKRIGLQLSSYDAYINVVGGLKIVEPACDLGIITAIASSFKNKSIKNDCIICGEVGLTGEVRAVSQIDKRINEAKRLGFNTCIIPKGNLKTLEQQKRKEINVITVNNVEQALDYLI